MSNGSQHFWLSNEWCQCKLIRFTSIVKSHKLFRILGNGMNVSSLCEAFSDMKRMNFAWIEWKKNNTSFYCRCFNSFCLVFGWRVKVTVALIKSLNFYGEAVCVWAAHFNDANELIIHFWFIYSFPSRTILTNYTHTNATQLWYNRTWINFFTTIFFPRLYPSLSSSPVFTFFL